MQNFKPIIRSYIFKYIFKVSSILLYACNTNYIEVISGDSSKEETYKSSEVNESQINIDELLAHKEIIQITNLRSISKIAILLPMTGKYSKVGC